MQPTERISMPLLIATIGVVYGDIGTSPLYALKQCFVGYGIPVVPSAILGILSLIIWSLIVVVTLKYVCLIMRASNQGEGGVLALAALCLDHSKGRMRKIVIMLGLTGTALFYGDAAITPAISVLSALEGLAVWSPHWQIYVLPGGAVLLIALFLVQQQGSRHIGHLFGPVMLIWFIVIALLGIPSIMAAPHVLAAFNPLHGFHFVAHYQWLGFLVMGAVVLVVTGAEALYADMGHFTRKAIQFSWVGLAFPCLILNYLGQGALLLLNPTSIENPFYLLAPTDFLPALIILSTAATIIASQAVISGVFSLSWQAMQLGYLPRMRVMHTSNHWIGQVYVPFVNYALLLLTLFIVFHFRSSDNLAAAYGMGFTAIMFITTILAVILAWTKWQWSGMKLCLIFTPLSVMDAWFLGANLEKFKDGAWLPVLLTVMIYQVMLVWQQGLLRLHYHSPLPYVSLTHYIKTLLAKSPLRVPGTAIFLTAHPHTVPSSLPLHLEHNKCLHEQLLFVSIITKPVPHVPHTESIKMERLEEGIYQLQAYHGYATVPNITHMLEQLQPLGVRIHMAETSFYITEHRPIPAVSAKYFGLREKLFVFLYRNAYSFLEHFNIPYRRVIRLGHVYPIRLR